MSEVSTPVTAEKAVRAYIATWNEFDGDKRRILVAETFTDDATYVDPHSAAAGHDDLDALIGAAQGNFPGHSITLAAGPDAHHDRVRLVWHLMGPDGGEPLAVGTDIAAIASDGRMREVTGFRGPL